MPDFHPSAPTPAHGDEAELVAGLRRGDEDAYETLVRRHGGRLLQVARRFVGSEEARDVVQEAFLAAFKSVGRFGGKSRISTWLHRIVVNTALMRLRKKSFQAEQSIEPLLPKFLQDGHRADAGPAWPESPEQILGRNELRELVHRAIDRLPPSHRSVLLLRDIEGLDGAETAARLEISPGAVKVRLHRARRALRELLAPDLRKEAA